MKTITEVDVLYHGRPVGKLASYKGARTAFQYDGEWLESGFSISPFSLPLERKVYLSSLDPFHGIFGVFDDSLPDGWGRLLMDRMLRKNGINPELVNSITRLSLLSRTGMGALEFVPSQASAQENLGNVDYDELKTFADQILSGKDIPQDGMDALFQMGGSSGGARPKGYVRFDKEDWIVKFPSSFDTDQIGAQEYRYNRTAAKCGIEVAECKLIPSKLCDGYFATKRFDRREGGRVHMVSIGGVLETSHRYPTMEYDHLFKCSSILTKSYSCSEQIYRRMCFNVFAHNRDDHAKNFAFLYEEGKGWCLSPAYDLTYSSSVNGEHATMVNGNGKDPGFKDLVTVGVRYSLDEKRAKDIAEEIQTIVHENLGEYLP